MARMPSTTRRHVLRSLVGLAALAAGGRAHASPPASGGLRGRVRIFDGGRPRKDHGGVVVFLESVPGPPPIPSAAPHMIRQHNKSFTPRVSAVVKGTTIAFPNDDKIFHNVFSMSRALKFDLGLYRSGSSKSVVASRVGIVDIYCNIHPEMAAKVVVVDNPFFAVTGEDGSFVIEGVPPGTYPVVAWFAHGEPHRGEVTIAPGESAEVAIDLEETSTGVEAHLRKDGSPYGRYK